MVKRFLSVLSIITMSAVMLVGLQGVAAAQDGCTYTVARTTGPPVGAPSGYSSNIVGRATWSCRNAPGVYAEIRVELFRNGNRIKSNLFGRYGTFTQTFAASVPCRVGVQRQYFTRTYGYDGGGPTTYVPKDSPSTIHNCL